MVLVLVHNKQSIGGPIFICNRLLSFIFQEPKNTLILG